MSGGLGGTSGVTLLISAIAFLGQTYMQRSIASSDAKQAAELEAMRTDMQRGLAESAAHAAVASRRRQKQESLEELMATLRRPLLASANDLQSRLAGMLGLRSSLTAPEPVPFLTAFMRRDAYYGAAPDPRTALDAAYAIESTLFMFGDFLAVLEVIRQTVSFLSGGNAAALNLLLDAIRFQFSGETPTQGAGVEGEDFSRLQLYAADQRAIGECMLLPASAGDAQSTAFRTLGYARFLELLNTDAAAVQEESRRNATRAAHGRDVERSF